MHQHRARAWDTCSKVSFMSLPGNERKEDLWYKMFSLKHHTFTGVFKSVNIDQTLVSRPYVVLSSRWWLCPPASAPHLSPALLMATSGVVYKSVAFNNTTSSDNNDLLSPCSGLTVWLKATWFQSLSTPCCKFTTMVTNVEGNGLGRARCCLHWAMGNNGGKQALFRMSRGGKVQRSSFTAFEGWTRGDRMVGHKGVSCNLLLQFGH